jgi:uncharacterized membrane protein (TIGR02234 family)
VVLDLAAAAVVLLLSTRVWQSVLLPRPRPLRDEVLHASGRTVTAAPTAFALVALAGVVAVLASRGVARRLIGAVLLAAGAGVIASAVGATSALSKTRIGSLAQSRNVVALGNPGTWQVSVHAQWAWGSVAAGVVIALAGVIVCVRGGRWAAMSARYSAPTATGTGRVDDRDAEARAQASMWSALERGDDPTSERIEKGE